MTKSIFPLFLISLSMLSFGAIGCAGPGIRSPAAERAKRAESSPPEKLFTEWQEEKHRHYFDWPVDDARMTRGYIPHRRKPHLGLDLAAPRGTRILASHDGTVIYAGRDFRGFGKMVMIEGTRGWATLYAHLHSINVKEGQRVSQGELIGGMGRTGRATGVHLHFEIRKTSGPVDPLQYLPGGPEIAHN